MDHLWEIIAWLAMVWFVTCVTDWVEIKELHDIKKYLKIIAGRKRENEDEQA